MMSISIGQLRLRLECGSGGSGFYIGYIGFTCVAKTLYCYSATVPLIK
jgi:hypothetical protein